MPQRASGFGLSAFNCTEGRNIRRPSYSVIIYSSKGRGGIGALVSAFSSALEVRIRNSESFVCQVKPHNSKERYRTSTKHCRTSKQPTRTGEEVYRLEASFTVILLEEYASLLPLFPSHPHANNFLPLFLFRLTFFSLSLQILPFPIFHGGILEAIRLLPHSPNPYLFLPLCQHSS